MDALLALCILVVCAVPSLQDSFPETGREQREPSLYNSVPHSSQDQLLKRYVRSGRWYRNLRRKMDHFRFRFGGLGKRDGKENTARDENMPIFLKRVPESHVMSLKNEPWHSVEEQRQNKLEGIKRMVKVQLFRFLTDAPDSIPFRLFRDSRVPETFSQESYPLQAGPQQTEAALDRNINEVGLQPPLQNEDMTGFLSGDVFGRLHPGKILLNSASSDDSDLDTSSESGEDTNDVIGLSKRWWAMNHFNRNRSPKSSQFTSRRHLDPVFYFLGLGK